MEARIAALVPSFLLTLQLSQGSVAGSESPGVISRHLEPIDVEDMTLLF